MDSVDLNQTLWHSLWLFLFTIYLEKGTEAVPNGLWEYINLSQTHTVHKLNDCLQPMGCIPETQFIMRSKIHLAVLLHLQCKCEREEDSQFGQILL